MRINAKYHMQQTTTLDPENPYFEVQVCPKLQILRCGGIEIFGKFILVLLYSIDPHFSLQ